MTNHPGKIVIDLDGVLAGPRPEGGSYLDCVPNGPVVRRLRELRSLGWTIAIHTSRNVKTHDHNLGKITAKTVPDIVSWLEQHDVPYDEIWPNKPWPGGVGFYVDDRAVQPRELLELSTAELLNRARGVAFDPNKPNWSAGTEQVWAVLDARSRYRMLVNGSGLRAIKQLREEGIRTLILIDAAAEINPGFDEQLRRLGARWQRFESRTPFNRAVVPIFRELVLEGLASYDSILFETYPHEEDGDVLESRHFNRVTASKESVTKTADDHETQLKLHFEYRWLEAASNATGGTATPGQLFPLSNGYRMRRAEGGSLNHVLLRERLDVLDIEALSQGLADLWGALNTVLSDKLYGDHELRKEHQQLIRDKSYRRLTELENLLEALGAGSTYTPWIVNGEDLGTLREALEALIDFIPTLNSSTHGPWHGDLCPGNVILFDHVHEDGVPDMRLIDPRGTIDGETVALFGDQRYDLAKLAHALHWGYDAITEGWRDCFWQLTPSNLLVNLRVWDEDFPGFEPNRTKLWNKLVLDNDISTGGHALGDPIIDALAALQLITCAPLHRDDPERMIALVARGLQAARYSLRKAHVTDRQDG